MFLVEMVVEKPVTRVLVVDGERRQREKIILAAKIGGRLIFLSTLEPIFSFPGP